MLQADDGCDEESDIRQTRAVGRVRTGWLDVRPISWRVQKDRMDSSAPQDTVHIAVMQRLAFVQGQARVARALQGCRELRELTRRRGSTSVRLCLIDIYFLKTISDDLGVFFQTAARRDGPCDTVA